MKNEKIYKQYVDDIIQELPLSKHTTRFREELLQHMEDCEENLNNPVGTNISKHTMQKIGDKDLIIQTYREFHRKFHSKLLFLELIVYALLSLLIYFISAIIPNFFETTYLYSDHSNPLFFGIINLCAAIFFALTVNYTFYNFLSVRLSLHLESDDRKQRLLVLFFFLPAISALTNLMSAFYTLGQAQLWGILIAPLPFLCAFLPALINFRIIRKDRKNTRIDAALPYLTLVIFLIFLLLVAAADKIPFSEILQPLQVIATIFYGFHFILFALIDVIVNLPYFGLFPINTSSSASYVSPVQMVIVNIVIAAAYVLSLGLGGVLALRSARKQKDPFKKRWERAMGLMLCVYALFVFLPIKSINAPVIDWKVPMIEVSKQIEKKQFGVFYDFIKFKNDDEGYIYNYDVCGTENGFIASQSSGNVFILNTTNVSSINEIKAVHTEKQNKEKYCLASPTENYDAESLFFFQEGWKYLDKNDAPLSMNERSGSCVKITYNDYEVLQASYENSMREIQSINMSADDNWALIKMADIYSVDFLYLVDLRELK